MSQNATIALTKCAAVAEGRGANNPSEDCITAIDDILSVTQNISFFGSRTKSYVNARDRLSGSFCTIPVCYDFKDRETRIQAEQTLRQVCKVNCATPYPPILWECIKRTIESGKRARPDNFVRVHLDLPRLALKLSWRARDSQTWSKYDKLIPVPQAAYDVKSRDIPADLEIENLPEPLAGLTSQQQQQGPPGSPSRPLGLLGPSLAPSARLAASPGGGNATTQIT